MGEVVRSGPKNMVGTEYYDVDSFDVGSFCPDSNDASTPATQVHVAITIAGKAAHFVMRYHSSSSLDQHIEALIEHRTYVFGKRPWHSEYETQS